MTYKTSHLHVWGLSLCTKHTEYLSLPATWTQLVMSLPRSPIIPAQSWGRQKILFWATGSLGREAIRQFENVRTFLFISGINSQGIYRESYVGSLEMLLKPKKKKKKVAKHPKGWGKEDNISQSKKGQPEWKKENFVISWFWECLIMLDKNVY